MGIDTYNRRKEQGLCPLCGKYRTRGKEHKICKRCREKIREYQRKRLLNMNSDKYKEHVEAQTYATKKRQQYLKDNNLCVECGKVTVEYASRCDKCRVLHNKKQRDYYEENKFA